MELYGPNAHGVPIELGPKETWAFVTFILYSMTFMQEPYIGSTMISIFSFTLHFFSECTG